MPTAHPSIPKLTLNDGTTVPQLGHETLAVQPDRESTEQDAKMTAEIVSQALEVGYRHATSRPGARSTSSSPTADCAAPGCRTSSPPISS